MIPLYVDERKNGYGHETTIGVTINSSGAKKEESTPFKNLKNYKAASALTLSIIAFSQNAIASPTYQIEASGENNAQVKYYEIRHPSNRAPDAGPMDGYGLNRTFPDGTIERTFFDIKEKKEKTITAEPANIETISPSGKPATLKTAKQVKRQ